MTIIAMTDGLERDARAPLAKDDGGSWRPTAGELLLVEGLPSSLWSATRAATALSAPTSGKRTSPRPIAAPPPAPRVVTRWILSRRESLTEIEQLRLKAALSKWAELDALTGRVRSFAHMPTERRGERLLEWLDAVRQDDLPSLHALATGIDRDRDAVIAGLTLPWNSGVVEGHVNGIKMLKRQMFGRAGFPLLRKRVLLS